MVWRGAQRLFAPTWNIVCARRFSQQVHAERFLALDTRGSCVRNFHKSAVLWYPKGKVTVHFKFPDGKRKTVVAKVGTNLLDVVIDHDVDIDGFGACEGTLACSTCHVILPQDVYDKLPPPVDEELDMLDLAYELTDTSRLGCQVILTEELDGLEISLPIGLADARG